LREESFSELKLVVKPLNEKLYAAYRTDDQVVTKYKCS